MCYKNKLIKPIMVILVVLFSCGLSFADNSLTTNGDFEAALDPNEWTLGVGSNTTLINTDSAVYGTHCIQMVPDNIQDSSSFIHSRPFPATAGYYYSADMYYKTSSDFKLLDGRTFTLIIFYDASFTEISTELYGENKIFKNSLSWTPFSTFWVEAPSYTAWVVTAVAAGTYAGTNTGKMWVDNIVLHSCSKINFEDINRDCVVDFMDYALLAQNWLKKDQ